MRKSNPRNLPEEVEALRRRIAHWRLTRKRISPMPESLWATAATFAAKHGVCPIARAVGVDYASLKNRMRKDDVEAASTSCGFIELPTASLLPPNQSEAVLELSDASGAKMTWRVNGRVDLDVGSMATAFWNRRDRNRS